MKVCVLNFSGNVGKTTVAAHLIAPRLGAKLFSVESLNSDAAADGVELQRIKAKQYADLQSAILAIDNAVVDVGASNVETFLKLMGTFAGSHEDYDLFVIPVVKEKKQLADSVNTLQTLCRLGVHPSKLRVVLNMVDPDDDIEADFAPVLVIAQDLDLQVPHAVMYRNELFERLKGSGRNLASVAADTTDYRVLIKQADAPEEKHRLIDRLAEQRLSVSCKQNMDQAFRALVA